MTLTKAKEGDKISPKSGIAELSERQQAIYESLKGQVIRIKRLHSKGFKATSQISGRAGKRTFWAEYVRITKNGEKEVEDKEHRFLSNHDLETYFGYTISEKASRHIEL